MIRGLANNSMEMCGMSWWRHNLRENKKTLQDVRFEIFSAVAKYITVFWRDTMLSTVMRVWKKGKGKVHPCTGTETLYRSYGTALEGGEGLASPPGHSLPPGKTRYLLYRRLGGPQGRSGQVRKIPAPTGIRSPGRPPVASGYND